MIEGGLPVANFWTFLALRSITVNCRRGDHGDQIIETELPLKGKAAGVEIFALVGGQPD
jgi:hypothetical protein